ncbi:VOC family protein [Halioxenophilus sp. WMMB6]|uniref:VOC family protein n=1 Tax=Halioxenophilus sp. WMMB6 TaxID=3073815 RepID=UPI00295ECE4F|nr:VOC family protein [Halioxenophilus sp. WMMB6]
MNQPVSALIRATIFVRDLARSINFYRELGFNQTYFRGELEHPSATAVLGLQHHHPYEIAIVKVAGPNFGMLGLFQLAAEQQAHSLPLYNGPARTGEVALIFYVAALDEVLPKLKAAGALWLPEPQLFELGPIRQREVCLRDCDGTLINLVERDPALQNISGPELEF